MQTQTAAIGGSPHMVRDVHDTYAKLSDPHRTQVNVVLSAFRAFRGDRRAHVGYVTVPVTTGKRFYDVLTREGVLTREELAQKRGGAFMYEEIIKPNIDESIRLVDQLGLEEDRLFIAPSVFEAKALQWTDDAYMALWYRVIGEMAGKHVLVDGWGYSYGGVREVLFSLMLQFRAIRMSNLKDGIEHFGLQNFFPNMTHDQVVEELQRMWAIRIYENGREVRLPDALAECTRVIAELHARGFDVENLLGVALRMKKIPFFVPAFYEPYPWVDVPAYREAARDLDALAAKIESGKGH